MRALTVAGPITSWRWPRKSCRRPTRSTIRARATTVELVLNPDGEIVKLETSKGSGFAGFDDAAKDVLRDSVPFPHATVELRSDDGLVHLSWVFARDEHRCSGVSLIRYEEPLPIAIPKLVRDGREEEVVRRMRVARAGGAPAEPMLTALATSWLKATVNRPYATAAVAEMLATMGDDSGIAWLKTAVKRPETAAAAGRALVAHHVPVCPLVKSALPAPDAAAGAKTPRSPTSRRRPPRSPRRARPTARPG